MDDVHLSTAARHFRYELRLGGKFSAAIWSAGGVLRITRLANSLTKDVQDDAWLVLITGICSYELWVNFND